MYCQPGLVLIFSKDVFGCVKGTAHIKKKYQIYLIIYTCKCIQNIPAHSPIKFRQVWTHSHTHSNQQSRERHLIPADIPPQDERFYTAVTLSKHQDETAGDGRAGSEET